MPEGADPADRKQVGKPMINRDEQEPTEGDELKNAFYWGQWASRNNESVSGQGSTLFYTESLRKALPTILRGLKVKKLLDAPCGDFNWMRHVDLDGIDYLGLDIVEKVVEHNQERYSSDACDFAHGDITKDPLPDADLMICRDCLMHLPYKYCWDFLENFANSRIGYLLTTTHNNPKNRDIEAPGGFHRLNLRMPPFSFPDSPILLHDWIRGARWPERYLGLWTREDVREVLLSAESSGIRRA
jgi:SAM-dependent methyltransferase